MNFYIFYSSYYHWENAIEACSEEDARTKLTTIEWLQGLHDPAAPWELVQICETRPDWSKTKRLNPRSTVPPVQ